MAGGLACCWLIGSLISPAPGAEGQTYVERLEALAARCEGLGLKEQAAVTRAWLVRRYPGRQYLFLPAVSDPAAPKQNAPMVEQQWYKKFMELRRERAEEAFAEAKAASDGGNGALAYQLLFEVLREDPDHSEARRILGYVKNTGGAWMLPGEEKMAVQQPRLDHPKLNWRARSYWRLETPHFQIVSDHSAREALEAGEQLEKLHALWRQVYFRYWSTPAALAERIAGRNEPLALERPKMQVVLFKSRDEYVKQLTPAEPQIEMTVGYYDQKQRITFFYAGDTSVYPTWYHEGTHQLFQEAVPGTSSQPGEERNFWAIEGAALYMESLVSRSSYWTVGGCEAERLQFARNRALSGEFLMPLARLVEQGREQLQKSPDIRRLYGQAAGVAHFLIDGSSGRYRERFVDLLSSVYRGQDAGHELAKTTGKATEVLDEEYRAFLDVTDEDLAGIPEPGRVRSLLLGRTSVTDKGLAQLKDCMGLLRLDLSLTATTDEGFKNLSGATGLAQLFLGATKVTDASLPLVVSFKQLEDLDLAGLAISDEGLAALAGLKKLKELRLDGTPITDAGLVHLRGLKQLETLSIEKTKVTAEGIKRLRTALPKVRISPQS